MSNSEPNQKKLSKDVIRSENGFKTERLSVSTAELWSETAVHSKLLDSVLCLLTPAVVKSLPGNFQGITSLTSAENWLKTMMAESQLFVVQLSNSDNIVGFIFLYDGEDGTAHVGYLLGESYWGRGLATELMTGFVSWCTDYTESKQLIAGVEQDNQASVGLLVKLGFTLSEQCGDVDFYHYFLNS